jgi:Rrf2 family transcriptional regulator, cysteine metabolism repressor
MRLSKKSEYACLALIYLSREYDKENLIRIADISSAQNIPQKYLEQIMLLLKNSGYVIGVRGVNGGYKLAKNPGDITMAQIIRLIDGALSPVASASKYYYTATPIEKEEKLLNVFKEIRNSVSDKLEATTFEDLI